MPAHRDPPLSERPLQIVFQKNNYKIRMISYNSCTISDNKIMDVANFGECKDLRVLTRGLIQIE